MMMERLSETADETKGAQTPSLASRPSIPILCVVAYLLTVLCLFLLILHRNGGTFTYSLDDPYIHLALAENLAHGHYGINPGEPSSPSSSILWPFLLVPFAPFAWGVYAPLALNLLACGAAAWLIGRTVERWGLLESSARIPWWVRLTAALLLILASNLVGLTFVGMEHGLQVLLAIACAAGLAEAYAGRILPRWAVAAAVLGPLIRYENLALTLAVAIVLFALGRRRAALTIFALSLVGPALFSAYLVSRGLPALPSSILVKSQSYSTQAHGLLFRAWHIVSTNLDLSYKTHIWRSLVVVLLILFALAYVERRRIPKAVLAATSFAVVLHLLLGASINWFFRYEVYCVAFSLLLACTALFTSTRIFRPILLVLLFVFARHYLRPILQTPAATGNIYQQQYQMHRLLAAVHPSIVAVNDIGLVSYRRPPGLYVLDLWGLASPDASRQAYKSAAWLDTVTTSHHAGLVIFYPAWYPEGAPDDWQSLGSLCITGQLVTAAFPCADIYSTPSGDHDALAAAVADFAHTLPSASTLTLGKSSADGN